VFDVFQEISTELIRFILPDLVFEYVFLLSSYQQPRAELTDLSVFVIIEYLAYTWYTLSYIPYARTAVLKMIGMS